MWFLLQIVSDSDAIQDVYYIISGPGYDQYPANVFSLDRNTGAFTVHKPVDREMFPSFTVSERYFNYQLLFGL